jgi:uncharacterized repeat protein (TIGR03803 family)
MRIRSTLKIAGAIFLFFSAIPVVRAQTFNSLVSFDISNGAIPGYGNLAQGRDGRLYGTTSALSTGSVFSLTAAGVISAERMPESLQSPYAGLVLGVDGNLYGTTFYGGDIGECLDDDGVGCGAIFKGTPGGNLTQIYSFCAQANCADGAKPIAGLIQAADGNFYGTTSSGGGFGPCFLNCGTIFKITPTGTLTTLHIFCSQGNCNDGAIPHAGLVQGTDGNFYGTTSAGGLGTECNGGCGTVFEITPRGTLSTLHSFALADGAQPFAGVVQAADGDFYGTTFEGGGNTACEFGCGTVFKISRNGTLTTLHTFDSMDGAMPVAGLVQGTDGNFYGTTVAGGVHNAGTIFSITPKGLLTTLYNFCAQLACGDGGIANGGLLQSTDGVFYGTTSAGGSDGYGSVYSLGVGLAPFITFVHNSGRVGETGGILGQGFIGTTSVAINGIQANFTIVSDTFMRATVPAGATTGYVTVVTPSGTLTSNGPFRVIP